MKILVIGGTGLVGSGVVRELLARDVEVEVSVLTRSADHAKHLPAGVRAVVGNVLDPTTVRTVFKGMDAVFLVNPVSTTETHESLMAFNGAVQAGVWRLVYMSVQKDNEAAHLPHFGAKLPVQAALAQSDMAYTILKPNNFYQNDLWLKDVLLNYHVYAQPIGNAGLSRVDVADIAEAAAIALTTSGHDRQTYNLVGPDVLTGQSTAEIWSRALGRHIDYGGDDLEAWEMQSLQYMPDWKVYDFKLMYAYFQQHGLVATPEDLQRLTRLLGHPPRSFDAFTRDMASVWLG